MFGKQYRTYSSSLCSLSTLPCYLAPLRPKQHPSLHQILKHP
jgi:hypothetical protein